MVFGMTVKHLVVHGTASRISGVGREREQDEQDTREITRGERLKQNVRCHKPNTAKLLMIEKRLMVHKRNLPILHRTELVGVRGDEPHVARQDEQHVFHCRERCVACRCEWYVSHCGERRVACWYKQYIAHYNEGCAVLKDELIVAHGERS